MKQVLIVVDMQNDFVSGSLGTREAAGIVDRVAEKIRKFEGEIIVTMDTHEEDYLNTQEGKRLPIKHCIRNTEGWQLVPAIREVLEGREYRMLQKPSFASLDLINIVREMEKKALEIELIGLCTDICVVSNALLLKANFPEIPLVVDSSCCAGVTPHKHGAALETMASCHIEVK